MEGYYAFGAMVRFAHKLPEDEEAADYIRLQDILASPGGLKAYWDELDRFHADEKRFSNVY